MMGAKWTQEQKDAASAAAIARHAASKSADAKSRLRIGAGGKRDILSIPEQEDGYKYRVVNDSGSRIDNLKERGYEMVEDVQLGTSHVDGNNSDGVVSRDVGKGTTAYLMRQKNEHYNEDKADKQALIDESEEAMRRKKVNSNESTDGTYGEVKIG
jgi:hypothetical protein